MLSYHFNTALRVLYATVVLRDLMPDACSYLFLERRRASRQFQRDKSLLCNMPETSASASYTCELPLMTVLI